MTDRVRNDWKRRLSLALAALRGANLVLFSPPLPLPLPESNITIRKARHIEEIPNPGIDPITVEKLNVCLLVESTHGLRVRWADFDGDDVEGPRHWTTLKAGDKLQLDVESWGKIDG